jgi:hypothetical protein
MSFVLNMACAIDKPKPYFRKHPFQIDSRLLPTFRKASIPVLHIVLLTYSCPSELCSTFWLPLPVLTSYYDDWRIVQIIWHFLRPLASSSLRDINALLRKSSVNISKSDSPVLTHSYQQGRLNVRTFKPTVLGLTWKEKNTSLVTHPSVLNTHTEVTAICRMSTTKRL